MAYAALTWPTWLNARGKLRSSCPVAPSIFFAMRPR